jgi:hypothetical protein
MQRLGPRKPILRPDKSLVRFQWWERRGLLNLRFPHAVDDAYEARLERTIEAYTAMANAEDAAGEGGKNTP